MSYAPLRCNNKTLQMKDIFIKTLEDRVHEYGCIETSAIKFYPELLKACEQNVCGKYNASWSCPPATEPMEKQIQKVQSYSHAFVYTTRGLLEDSFDYEGMQEAASVHRKITLEMHDIYGKVNPVYGAGSCSYCEKCAYPNSCSYPDKLFYSI